jgi:hypothetical protein
VHHRVNGQGLPYNFPFITYPPQAIPTIPTAATPNPPIDPRINAMLNARFNFTNDNNPLPGQQQQQQPSVQFG